MKVDTSLSSASSTFPEIGVPESVFDDQMAYIRVTRKGISGRVVKNAVRTLGHRELFTRVLGTTSSNLSRLYKRKALDKAQSENILDTIGILRKALLAFGNAEKADAWLNAETHALGGKTPASLCDTFKGRGMVELVLRKIEYGDFA